MFEKIKHLKVSRRILYFLAEKAENLEQHTLQRSFDEATIYPDKHKAAKFLDRSILALGVIFMICGLIFFFAYNWAGLHKFVKLGLVLALIIGSGVFTLLQKPDSYLRKIGLTALCALTGTIFALFGQIYQTGANAYDFFLGWTLLITVWVAISRFAPLWVFYLCLINITIFLYAGQVHRVWGAPWVLMGLMGINSLALIIWEYLAQTRKGFIQSRLVQRVAIIAILGITTFIAQEALWDWRSNQPETAYLTNWVLLISIYAIVFIIYQSKIKDLFFLGVGASGLLWILCMVTIKVMISSRAEELSFFFISILVVAYTILAAKWLLGVNKKWKEELSHQASK